MKKLWKVPSLATGSRSSLWPSRNPARATGTDPRAQAVSALLVAKIAVGGSAGSSAARLVYLRAMLWCGRGPEDWSLGMVLVRLLLGSAAHSERISCGEVKRAGSERSRIG